MNQDANPLISVVMPVYNGERYLHEAIDSIIQQSFTDFEFIIINDGSTDNTENIILSYKDPRIVYIKNETNLKIIKTLNKGIDLARGKYIARMDADDISVKDRFEKQIEIFDSNKSTGIVNAKAYFLNEDGKQYREQKSQTIKLSSESIKYLIYLQNFICHPAVMIKSDLLKKYKYVDNLVNEDIEDFELWNRMLKDGVLCYTIDERLLFYRNNPVSINHTKTSNQVQSMSALCTKMLKESFGFEINKDSLEILLSEGGPINYNIIEKLNAELIAYILLIKNSSSISPFAYNEMMLWRKQRLILISLKSLNQISFAAKLGVLTFLVLHLSWFVNRSVLTFIKRSIYPKYFNTPVIASRSN